MTEIKHIVFDVGNVLLRWNPELIYMELIPDPAERQIFLTNVCNSTWNLEQDRGRDWQEAEDDLIARFPEKEELIRAYRKRWMNSIPHAFEDIVSLLHDLIEADHDVTILSNFNQETFEECTVRFPFLDLPRGATVSGRIGLVKPDAQIYHHHVEQFELTAKQCLFIDDSEANVIAARACGWNAIQFFGDEGRKKLEDQLTSLGIHTDR